MTTDVLSDVLRAVRLTGAVYFDFDLSSPWVAEAPPCREIAATVMPGAERVIEYHLIARGACWGHAVGQEPIRLREGDIDRVPAGRCARALERAGDARAHRPLDVRAQRRAAADVHEMGGGGPERARIVCCFLGCDERPYNPLFAALPQVIHLSAAGPRTSTGWLATLVDIAAKESRSARPGSENVLARLSELMFVETVRRYLETLPPAETGWLAGLRDPVVGQALAAMHGEADDAWTVEGLARLAGVSRSVFAERFTAMVGQPPMQYLALWRMQLASRLLIDGARSPSCDRCRLRVRGRVQPRVQEAGRRRARNLAQDSRRFARQFAPLNGRDRSVLASAIAGIICRWGA